MNVVMPAGGDKRTAPRRARAAHDVLVHPGGGRRLISPAAPRIRCHAANLQGRAPSPHRLDLSRDRRRPGDPGGRGVRGVVRTPRLLGARWQSGTAAVVPTVEGRAAALALRSRHVDRRVPAGALSALLLVGGVAGWEPTWVFRIGCGGLAVVMLAWAIGDFRTVGFFKRVRDTQFARNDTRDFVPSSSASASPPAWSRSPDDGHRLGPVASRHGQDRDAPHRVSGSSGRPRSHRSAATSRACAPGTSCMWAATGRRTDRRR